MGHSIRDAVWDGAGGDVAFDCGQHFSGKVGAEFFVGVASEPCAQVLVGHAVGQVLAQQTFNGFGDEWGRASVAHGAGDCSVLADRSS
jgi:hypothetical protein